MRFTPIFTKKTKLTPSKESEYSKRNPTKNSIIIKRDDKMFEYFVGDLVEYDSYNLSYIGKITKITDKTISIDKNGRFKHIDDVEIKRLSLYEFCYRNFGDSIHSKTSRNVDTMRYI